MKKYSLETILPLFKQVHGEKYDYSLFEYISYKDKSIIICPIHGEFPKSPAKHIAGQGCPDCATIERVKKRALSQEQAIQKGIDLFGDKFDYSEMQYVNQNTLVKITCKIHNHSFDIRPQDHWYSVHGGCKFCDSEATSERKRYTTEEFITKASAIHQSIYDYSEVIYVKDDVEVIIRCPLHNITFKQEPKYHLQGKTACKHCERIKRGVGKLKGKDLFVEQANKLFNNKYDYSLFEYKSYHEVSTILCPEHGEFTKDPSHHLRGQGCPICATQTRGINSRKTTETFIKEAKEVHGDLYNYQYVNYITQNDLVNIKCNRCQQIFKQRPSDHLQGRGCKDCNQYNTYSKSGYIEMANGRQCTFYLLHLYDDMDDESFYKLGITVNTVKRRYSSENEMPYNYETVLLIKGSAEYVWTLENEVKKLLTQFRYQPDISFPGSKTECYQNYDDIYDVLKTVINFPNLKILENSQHSIEMF